MQIVVLPMANCKCLYDEEVDLSVLGRLAIAGVPCGTQNEANGLRTFRRAVAQSWALSQSLLGPGCGTRWLEAATGLLCQSQGESPPDSLGGSQRSEPKNAWFSLKNPPLGLGRLRFHAIALGGAVAFPLSIKGASDDPT